LITVLSIYSIIEKRQWLLLHN